MFRLFIAFLIAYPTAAMLSSHVSLAFSATLWGSFWTYVMLLVGFVVGVVGISVALFLLAMIGFTATAAMRR